MKRTLVTLLLLIATVALYAADKPSFPGGDQALNKYLAENLHYPKQAQDNGIEGNVPIQFIVKAAGTISSIKVTRMIDPDLEAWCAKCPSGFRPTTTALLWMPLPM